MVAEALKPINVTVVDKWNDRYVFLYEDGRELEVFHTAGRWAGDPDLTFSWRDCARVSREVQNVRIR